MREYSTRPDELTPFERGIDFMLHYRGKSFTIKDIAERYGVTYRQAQKIRDQIDHVVGLTPDGR